MNNDAIFQHDKAGRVGPLQPVGNLTGLTLVGIGFGKRLFTSRQGADLARMRHTDRGIFLVKAAEILIYGIGLEHLRILIHRPVFIYLLPEGYCSGPCKDNEGNTQI